MRIAEFEALATKMVGDSKKPNLFFISGRDGSIVAIMTAAFYSEWDAEPHSKFRVEDRKIGVVNDPWED